MIDVALGGPAIGHPLLWAVQTRLRTFRPNKFRANALN